MIDGDLARGALAFADKVVAEKRPLKRVRDLKVEHRQRRGASCSSRATRWRAMAKNFPAPLKCVDAVAASVEQAVRRRAAPGARALHGADGQTPESRALRHAFFAERAAAKIPDVPDDTPLRAIKQGRRSSAPAPWAAASR